MVEVQGEKQVSFPILSSDLFAEAGLSFSCTSIQRQYLTKSICTHNATLFKTYGSILYSYFIIP